MKAQMYTGTSRGSIENDWYRSLSIFNNGNFQQESRKPFGTITAFNDETLAAAYAKDYAPESGTCVVVPMIGSVAFQNHGQEIAIRAGEMLCVDARVPFSIRNPYEHEQVNYLIIRISSVSKDGFLKRSSILEQWNAIQPAFGVGETKGHIALFEARQKGVFSISEGQKLFVFVINGAFEFEERLLETRDALSIVGMQKFDFEALSGNAIMLLIEAY